MKKNNLRLIFVILLLSFATPAFGRNGVSSGEMWGPATNTNYGFKRVTPTPSIGSQPEYVPSVEPKKPPTGLTRFGFFQKVDLESSYTLDFGGGDGLGMSDTSASVSVVIPGPLDQSFLLFTPGFRVTTFDSQGDFWLPETVYSTTLGTTWKGRVRGSKKWMYQGSVSLGIHSDFRGDMDNGFRMNGYALALYQWTPKLMLMFGAAYTDLFAWGVIPAGGLVWNRSETERWSLIFPRPSVAWRCRQLEFFLPRREEKECWFFIGAQLTGGTWEGEMADTQMNTEFSYSEWRLLTGLEYKLGEVTLFTAELGLSFARGISYEDGRKSRYPDESLFFRVGMRL